MLDEENEKDPSVLADQIINSLEVDQLGETFSSGIVSVSQLAAVGEWSENTRHELSQNIRERHMLECVEIENALREDEIQVNFGIFALMY